MTIYEYGIKIVDREGRTKYHFHVYYTLYGSYNYTFNYNIIIIFPYNKYHILIIYYCYFKNNNNPYYFNVIQCLNRINELGELDQVHRTPAPLAIILRIAC